MSSVLLNLGKDQNGSCVYGPLVSPEIYRAALAQNAETHINAPSTYSNYYAVFSYEAGAVVHVDCTGASATIPVNTTLQATTTELTPQVRRVAAGQQISMITSDTSAVAYVSFYGIQ